MQEGWSAGRPKRRGAGHRRGSRPGQRGARQSCRRTLQAAGGRFRAYGSASLGRAVCATRTQRCDGVRAYTPLIFGTPRGFERGAGSTSASVVAGPAVRVDSALARPARRECGARSSAGKPYRGSKEWSRQWGSTRPNSCAMRRARRKEDRIQADSDFASTCSPCGRGPHLTRADRWSHSGMGATHWRPRQHSGRWRRARRAVFAPHAAPGALRPRAARRGPCQSHRSRVGCHRRRRGCPCARWQVCHTLTPGQQSAAGREAQCASECPHNRGLTCWARCWRRCRCCCERGASRRVQGASCPSMVCLPRPRRTSTPNVRRHGKAHTQIVAVTRGRVRKVCIPGSDARRAVASSTLLSARAGRVIPRDAGRRSLGTQASLQYADFWSGWTGISRYRRLLHGTADRELARDWAPTRQPRRVQYTCPRF